MLIEKYKQLFNSPNEWKYYNQLDIDVCPFDSEMMADSFIHKYFKTGNKESVLDSKIPNDKLRDIHSISTFFLGILFKPLCNLPELKPDFRYLWFIACLYHDYGYYIEKNKIKYPPQKYKLASIIKDLDIKYNLLESKYDFSFNLNTIKKYYRYCQKEHQFINHGIVGGLLLYDKLKKNFEENKKEALKQNPNLDSKDFEYNDLHWASSHKNYYKFVASSIISHNIWFAFNDENKAKYKKYKLDNLTIDDPNQRIACDSNPFLFLLLLADTIEPIKAFSQWKYSCILKKVNIENNNDRKITITVIDECLEYQNWFDKVIDLKNWLKVSVEQFDNKIEIKIE